MSVSTLLSVPATADPGGDECVFGVVEDMVINDIANQCFITRSCTKGNADHSNVRYLISANELDSKVEKG